MGAVADAFNACFNVVGPVDKADAAALGSAIETYIGNLTIFDLAGMPSLASLSGKAGEILTVNGTEDGFTTAPPP